MSVSVKPNHNCSMDCAFDGKCDQKISDKDSPDEKKPHFLPASPVIPSQSDQRKKCRHRHKTGDLATDYSPYRCPWRLIGSSIRRSKLGVASAADVDKGSPSTSLIASELASALGKYAGGNMMDAIEAIQALTRNNDFLTLPMKRRAEVYEVFGYAYQRCGSHTRAVDKLARSLGLFEKQNDTEAQCTVLGAIADSLTVLKNFDKAVEYYNKQIELAKTSMNSDEHIRGLLQLGICYMHQASLLKAAEVYERCLKTFCSDFDKMGYPVKHKSVAKVCLANLGLCLHQLGLGKRAIDAFDTCLQMLRFYDCNELYEKATLLTHKSCTLLMLGLFDSAIDTGTLYLYMLKFSLVHEKERVSHTGLEAISEFHFYRKQSGGLSDEQMTSLEQLESRAYTWIQLGQIQLGKYISSLATLEASRTTRKATGHDDSLSVIEYFNAIEITVKDIITMMNRPLFVFQTICLQGFSHQLVAYNILPAPEGKFRLRLRCVSLDGLGISDLRQWIMLCRYNIGLSVTCESNLRGTSSGKHLPCKRGSSTSSTTRKTDFRGDEPQDRHYNCLRIPHKDPKDPWSGHNFMNKEVFYRGPSNCWTFEAALDGNHSKQDMRKKFSYHQVDDYCYFDASDVSCFHHPRMKNYKNILDTIGPRPTYRLGTKCFQACREMYQVLLAPFENELCTLATGCEILILPLGPLMAVPFPCLQNAKEQYLIDLLRIRHLPSLMLTWQLNTKERSDILERASDVSEASTILADGSAIQIKSLRPGPSSLSMWRNVTLVGKSTFTSFPSLVGADTETFMIEELLLNFGVSCRSFSPDGPSYDEMLKALHESSLLHIASHGTDHFVVVQDAAKEKDYEFCSEDVYRIGFNKTLSPVLMILNSCANNQMDEMDHAYNFSLRRVLHENGVRCVVSSTSRVDDAVALDVMITFYNMLGSNPHEVTMDVVESMQKAMLHQSVLHPTDPSCWAGYIVSGFIRDITE